MSKLIDFELLATNRPLLTHSVAASQQEASGHSLNHMIQRLSIVLRLLWLSDYSKDSACFHSLGRLICESKTVIHRGCL